MKRFNRKNLGLLLTTITTITLIIASVTGWVNLFGVFSIIFFPSLGLNIYYLRKYMRGDDL